MNITHVASCACERRVLRTVTGLFAMSPSATTVRCILHADGVPLVEPPSEEPSLRPSTSPWPIQLLGTSSSTLLRRPSESTGTSGTPLASSPVLCIQRVCMRLVPGLHGYTEESETRMNLVHVGVHKGIGTPCTPGHPSP